MVGTPKSLNTEQNTDLNLQVAEGSPEFGRSLLHVLKNTGISVLYQDTSLETVWGQNIFPELEDAVLSNGVGRLSGSGQQLSRVAAVRRNVLSTGEGERIDAAVTTPQGVRWFKVWVDADKNAAGELQGIVTTAIDVTEEKRREQTLKTLLREVAHRSKNLLAIIQSIATQTGRYSGNTDTFLSRFRGRIQSLASSQDLVTSSNWRGADLRELVAGQVGKYSDSLQKHLRLDGEKPYLNPNAALHIGLAIHELAVNSASYGALSKPSGFVSVSSSLVPNKDGKPDLQLLWREQVGSGVTSLNEKRFGSIALEKVVPSSLNGEASLSLDDGWLEYRLLIPSGSFELE